MPPVGHWGWSRKRAEALQGRYEGQRPSRRPAASLRAGRRRQGAVDDGAAGRRLPQAAAGGGPSRRSGAPISAFSTPAKPRRHLHRVRRGPTRRAVRTQPQHLSGRHCAPLNHSAFASPLPAHSGQHPSPAPANAEPHDARPRLCGAAADRHRGQRSARCDRCKPVSAREGGREVLWGSSVRQLAARWLASSAPPRRRVGGLLEEEGKCRKGAAPAGGRCRQAPTVHRHATTALIMPPPRLTRSRYDYKCVQRCMDKLPNGGWQPVRGATGRCACAACTRSAAHPHACRCAYAARTCSAACTSP